MSKFVFAYFKTSGYFFLRKKLFIMNKSINTQVKPYFHSVADSSFMKRRSRNYFQSDSEHAFRFEKFKKHLPDRESNPGRLGESQES